MVKQTVHRKTFSSLGHRTVESHVMHFPVLRSLSAALADLLDVGFAGLWEDWASDSTQYGTSCVIAELSPSRFFFPANIEGNGWLIDLPCLEGRCPSWFCFAFAFVSLEQSTGML